MTQPAATSQKANSVPMTLVTGMPRGGTTAVGRLMSLPSRVVSLHEPLNGTSGLVEVRDYFDHIDRPDDPAACARIDQLATRLKTLKGLRFKNGLYQADTGMRGLVKRVIGGRVINTWRRARFDPFKTHVIWKDPFAAFMTGRLAAQHGIGSIVTLRNPWATAASFKRMGWGMELSHVRAATEGLARYGVAEDMLSPPKADSVGNATAMWVMLYAKVIADLQAHEASHAPLILLDLDHAIANPVPSYEGLYTTFGLPWSEAISQQIAATYAPKDGPARDMPKAGQAHDMSRDPSSFNAYWKKVLDEDEIARVTQMAGPLWEEISAQVAAR